MYCMKCNNELSQCTCSDINERLKIAVATGHVAYKKCTLCDKHYALCECANPQWSIERKPSPPANA